MIGPLLYSESLGKHLGVYQTACVQLGGHWPVSASTPQSTIPRYTSISPADLELTFLLGKLCSRIQQSLLNACSGPGAL